MLNALSLPFYSEQYDGFAYMNGFIKIKSHFLEAEYQTMDGILGVVKSKIKSIEIPFSDIADVKYKSNIFRTVMIITVNSFKAAAELGNGSEDIKFYVKRKNKKLAESFVDNVKLAVAEYQLKQLESGEGENHHLLE